MARRPSQRPRDKGDPVRHHTEFTQTRTTKHRRRYYTSTKHTRIYVLAQHRRTVFNGLHIQSHRGGTATSRLIKSRYCWPGMDKHIRYWVKCCIPCQRTKVSKHTVSPITPFAPPDRCFGHIHIDLVGPLPPSNGCKYLLTCIDCFTRWPEAWPIDMSAFTVRQH